MTPSISFWLDICLVIYAKFLILCLVIKTSVNILLHGYEIHFQHLVIKKKVSVPIRIKIIHGHHFNMGNMIFHRILNLKILQI